MQLARQQFFPDYNEIMQMKMSNFYGDGKQLQAIKSEARVRNPQRDKFIGNRIMFKQQFHLSNSARQSILSMVKSKSMVSHELRSDNSPVDLVRQEERKLISCSDNKKSQKIGRRKQLFSIKEKNNLNSDKPIIRRESSCDSS